MNSTTTAFAYGDILAQFLLAVAAVATPILAAYAVKLVAKLAAKSGVELNAARLDRLQEFVVNGLNYGATTLSDKAKKLPPAELKNVVVAEALVYAKAHGADTIKALGFDLNSREDLAKLEEALRGRIEKALNDPATPTPPEITPKTALPVVATVKPATS